ncbi:hypothetical protein [uncultured Leuconostoc sp.]|uniref:hypothetical protein n=1 Tax=uncultured Leuconostoc sp. TaxID=173262 RepID=UPI0025F7E7A7|nr:hypothetical protein [uncultured Leuconostoc sp.]
MQRLERVLPVLVFVVMLGTNLLNAPNLSIPILLLAIVSALIPGVIIFGLIKFLEWWMAR